MCLSRYTNRGLLISGMTDTARQMVFNFVYIIKEIYYTNRSHPPLFAAMVYAIYEETQDIEFVKKVLAYMEMEFDFWESNRKFDVTLASGESEEVFYYKTGTKMPRPESMWADLHASDQLDGDDREFFFEVPVAAPLFTNSYAVSDKNKPRRLFETLENMGFFSYAGGVPVSVVPDTKQQWDFPNG
ncbi:Trehalase [Aphelenchoides fujianensis]|nr:Trehalase [Aphelenchoides fujianensis]